MTTCTRILYAQCAKPADMERLKAACRNVGRMRAAIWQRWGGLGTVGKSVNKVRREITAANLFEKLNIDGDGSRRIDEGYRQRYFHVSQGSRSRSSEEDLPAVQGRSHAQGQVQQTAQRRMGQGFVSAPTDAKAFPARPRKIRQAVCRSLG